MDAYGAEPLPNARIKSCHFHNAITKISIICTGMLYSGSSSPQFENAFSLSFGSVGFGVLV